jgi:hypothetical protein
LPDEEVLRREENADIGPKIGPEHRNAETGQSRERFRGRMMEPVAAAA